MKYGLKEDEINAIQAVFSDFPQIEKVILYGSRAKGTYKIGSDIDITLIGNELDLTLLNTLELKLDDLYLPYKFDISILRQISNPDLVEHIERLGVDFYKRT